MDILHQEPVEKPSDQGFPPFYQPSAERWKETPEYLNWEQRPCTLQRVFNIAFRRSSLPFVECHRSAQEKGFLSISFFLSPAFPLGEPPSWR